MHESNHLAHRLELVLLDPNNPRSIASLMPEAFAKQMEALWNSDDASQLLGLTEPQLLRELARRQKSPAPIDFKLRVKFWLEFERVQVDVPKMAKMNMQNILGFDYPKESFYKYYITDHCKLAFLLCPPTDYTKMIDVVLTQSMYRLLDFLESQETIVEMKCGNNSLIRKVIDINEQMMRRKLGVLRSGYPAAAPRETADTEDSPPEPREKTEEEKRLELEALKKRLEQTLPGQTQ